MEFITRTMSLAAALSGASAASAAVGVEDFVTLGFKDGSSLELACDSVQMQEYDYERGKVRFPVREWSCGAARTGPKPAPAVVWLHGGPGHGWSESAPTAMQYMFLARGYRVLEPSYFGDLARNLDISTDTKLGATRAISEIRILFEETKRQTPHVVVFGESFGAFLAGYLSKRLRASDTLVLYNPFVYSPRYFYSESAPDGIFTPDDRVIRQQLASSPELRQRLKAYSEDYVARYFRSLETSTLGQNLRPSIRARVVIAYGEQDALFAPRDVEKLRDHVNSGATFLKMKGQGHIDPTSRSNFEALCAAIWDHGDGKKCAD
jgi:pimeloyl-ACP methyl ester carboxylesterase